jgi:signal transduction histidine kinase
MIAENVSDFTLQDLQKISKSMQTSASNLFSLLENLLEWSRMQRGQIVLNPQEFNLTKVINNNINLVNEIAKQKEIELSINIPEDAEITADEQMLNTIIRNLISNAIKFTLRGGKIEIGFSNKKSYDDYVVIYIKDSGIGMSANTISKLFRIDQNVSQKGTEGEPSTGLGLILCKDFIEKHGGKIWVESEVDKGSTFYFRLQ